MKKFKLVAIVAVVCLIISGCASSAASALLGPGNYFSDTVAVGVKRGEAKSTVVLGIFGKENYPSVERVARENGITRIATVERYSKPGFLLIWSEYTTIVTGE